MAAAPRLAASTVPASTRLDRYAAAPKHAVRINVVKKYRLKTGVKTGRYHATSSMRYRNTASTNTIAENARRARLEVSVPAHRRPAASAAQAIVIQFDSNCTGIAAVTNAAAVPSR